MCDVGLKFYLTSLRQDNLVQAVLVPRFPGTSGILMVYSLKFYSPGSATLDMVILHLRVLYTTVVASDDTWNKQAVQLWNIFPPTVI